MLLPLIRHGFSSLAEINRNENGYHCGCHLRTHDILWRLSKFSFQSWGSLMEPFGMYDNKCLDFVAKC